MEVVASFLGPFARVLWNPYRLPCSVNFVVLTRTGHTWAAQYFFCGPPTRLTPCEVDAYTHLLANRSCPTSAQKAQGTAITSEANTAKS